MRFYWAPRFALVGTTLASIIFLWFYFAAGVEKDLGILGYTTYYFFFLSDRVVSFLFPLVRPGRGGLTPAEIVFLEILVVFVTALQWLLVGALIDVARYRQRILGFVKSHKIQVALIFAGFFGYFLGVYATALLTIALNPEILEFWTSADVLDRALLAILFSLVWVWLAAHLWRRWKHVSLGILAGLVADISFSLIEFI
jgi:hypothetical protein